jgi:hypothetical protein
VPDLRARRARDLQREAHVLGDGHVRVQRVVLEDHRDVPVPRRHPRDVLLADHDLTAVEGLEPGEHAQVGGLPAPGGTDQHEELPVRDLQVERVDGRFGGARVTPGGLRERDCGHGGLASVRLHPDPY